MSFRGGFLMLLALLGSPAMAQVDRDRGRAVAEEADRRARGFGDMRATLRMTLRDGQGNARVRELRIAVLEEDGGEKTLLRFEAPFDLRGTALLTVTAGDGSSDQWLYLPSLRRTKRIAAPSRSGSFMGSEFSYEDIGTMDVDRYSYRFVGLDTLSGMVVWIVERRPVSRASRYRRQRVWFDSEEYRVLRIDFYDQSDTLLKTLELRGFRRYQGRYWRPDEMDMTNHQTGASTLVQWSEYAFGSGLSTADFSPNRLRRGG